MYLSNGKSDQEVQASSIRNSAIGAIHKVLRRGGGEGGESLKSERKRTGGGDVELICTIAL